MPFFCSFFCTGMKKSINASQLFGMSDSLKPAFSTRVRQMWNGTTAPSNGTP